MRVRTIAPAKVNLTLEVLGKRPDGYHEIASVMQTVALHDNVVIEDGDELTVEMTYPVEGEWRSSPAPPPWPMNTDLAYRAARALWGAVGGRKSGARILIEKNVPAGAGLGGGSSDAAAVLRGLNRLWGLGRDEKFLAQVGATLGSDVPFFVYGGTALVTGRGEQVEPLPDVQRCEFGLVTIEWRGEAKTANAYARLRPDDFTIGSRSDGLAELIRRGGYRPGAEDLFNAFDPSAQAESDFAHFFVTTLAEIGGAAIVCGAGPSLLCVAPPRRRAADVPRRVMEHVHAKFGEIPYIVAGTLPRAQATTIEEG